MDSIVTKFNDICFFCGKPAECEHHLVCGTTNRELSEQDGLKVPSCNKCHNMGRKDEKIHGNVMAEKLSKMLGQAIWEKEYCRKHVGCTDEEVRETFRKRYGKSFI